MTSYKPAHTRTEATEALARLVRGTASNGSAAASIVSQHRRLLQSFLDQRVREDVATDGHRALRQQMQRTSPPALAKALSAPQATFLLLVADQVQGLTRFARGLALEEALQPSAERHDADGWTLDGRAVVRGADVREQPVLAGGVVLDNCSPEVGAQLAPATDLATATAIDTHIVARALHNLTRINATTGPELVQLFRQLTTRRSGFATREPAVLTQASHPGLVVVPPLHHADGLAADDAAAALTDQFVLAAFATATSMVEAIDGWYGSDHDRGIVDDIVSPWTGQMVSGQQVVHDIVRWCGWISFTGISPARLERDMAPLLASLVRCHKLVTPELFDHWHLQPHAATFLVSLLDEVMP